MSLMTRVSAAAVLLISVPSCSPLCNFDSECDNGFWCDGEEFCDRRPIGANILLGLLTLGQDSLGGGLCANSPLPCCPVGQDCQDYTFQQIALDLCDEEQMQCRTADDCLANAECDDGIWCNGTELCLSGFCFPNAERCPFEETCDEQAMQCRETNRGACFRVLDWCPDISRTEELAEIALVLGTTDVPSDVMVFGDGVCNVPETAECDWPAYANCITSNVTCADLNAGHPEGTLSACLGVLTGADCFVHVVRPTDQQNRESRK